MDEIKLLPEASTLEQYVIIHAIQGRVALEEVYEYIRKPDFFYNDRFRAIYTALMNLRDNNTSVDAPIVIEELKRRKMLADAGGEIYIKKLARDVVSPLKIPDYCKRIATAYMQREVIRICTETRENVFEESDVFSCIASLEKELQEITGAINTENVELIGAIAKRQFEEIIDKRTNKVNSSGVSTGWSQLDDLTGGWQDTDLIYLAARPSVGKTAVLLNLLVNAATCERKPVHCLVFSLEMSKGQLTNRVLAKQSKVHLKKISQNVSQLTETDLNAVAAARDYLMKVKIHIDDKGASNMGHITAVSRKKVKREGVGLIAVDYVQLIRGSEKNKSREQEVSRISADLKVLAKDLGVPVIALAQLTREADDVEPKLAHLRESGSMEQDADVVGMIYRPSRKEIAEKPEKENMLILSIKKHRNGELGDIFLKFDKPTQEITQIEFEPEFKAGPPPNPTASGYQTGTLNFDDSKPKPPPNEEDTPF